MNQNAALAVDSLPGYQGEVSRELDQTAKNLETLGEAVEALELRLVSVVAERSETCGTPANAPEPVRVVLAQRIYNTNEVLTNLESRIRSITNRVEL